MLPLIQAVDPSYTMPTYSGGNDYWQLAVDYCDKVQNGAHLPSSSDLAKIARVLYGDNTISDANSYNYKDGLDWTSNKAEVFAALGIESTASLVLLWSSEPDGTDSAYFRSFDSTATEYFYDLRNDTLSAVCLE